MKETSDGLIEFVIFDLKKAPKSPETYCQKEKIHEIIQTSEGSQITFQINPEILAIDPNISLSMGWKYGRIFLPSRQPVLFLEFWSLNAFGE